MRRLILIVTIGAAVLASMAGAPQADPYKVLKMAKIGGEGGWDYIYADSAGRRLYIPRRGSPAMEATDTRPAWEAMVRRSTRRPATVSPAASRSRCSTPRP